MKNRAYKEKQTFDDEVVFTSLGLGIITSLIGSVKAIMSGENSMLDLAAALLLVLLVWWLTQLKMKLNVNDKRIKFKMSPIHGKSHKIAWNII